jgi:hypothetical protein
MNRSLFGVCFALTVHAALAATHVDGYMRKDGTYVPPHYRTVPDNSRTNNFSSQGNINPYTGREGTVNPYTLPDKSQTVPSWGNTPAQRRGW